MNWRTIAFLLENAVFLLIGLQARWILDDVARSGTTLGRIILVCVAALLAVLVLRFVWVFIARWTLFRNIAGPWSHTLLLGWAGMRGVVSLAAAFVIPDGTDYREVLLLIAFTVVAGTLLLQGLTLPWLVRRLAVTGADPAEDALARATLLEQASRSGLAVLDRSEYDDPHGVADLIRNRLEERNFAAWERLATHEEQLPPSELYARLRIDMLAAERARILEIRKTGNVAAEVIGEVLAMLDVEESMLEAATQEREELISQGVVPRRTGESCEHLASYPAVDTTPDPVCDACVADGVKWVSLRECLVCGEVGCCDSSPRRHSDAHFRDTGHPVIESAEPGEDWRWCYVDHVTG
jgi:CPA1 family monovalent cation:H+ antiporter